MVAVCLCPRCICVRSDLCRPSELCAGPVNRAGRRPTGTGTPAPMTSPLTNRDLLANWTARFPSSSAVDLMYGHASRVSIQKQRSQPPPARTAPPGRPPPPPPPPPAAQLYNLSHKCVIIQAECARNEQWRTERRKSGGRSGTAVMSLLLLLDVGENDAGRGIRQEMTCHVGVPISDN